MFDKVEILKTGTFKDSSGAEHTFTESDLDKIASSYDPNQHEAPVVIGHPKDNAPAFGWISRVFKEGQKLFCELKDVVPEFVDACKKGMYKKRSISLYPDKTVRHLGFLGAVPPAIKGLVDVQFTEGEPITIEISDFADDSDKTAQAARAKKYGIGIKEGGNVTKPVKYSGVDDDQFADPVNYRYPLDEDRIHAALSYWAVPDNRSQYGSEEVKTITKRILSAAKKNDIIIDEKKWDFNERTNMKTAEQIQAELDAANATIASQKTEIASFSEKIKTADTANAALKTENDSLKKKSSDQEAATRKAGHFSFCEKLRAEGRLSPKMVNITVDNLERAYLASQGNFAEGQVKPIDELKTLLSESPVVLEFKELATKEKSTSDAKGAATAGEKLTALVNTKMKENKGMNFSEALRQVSVENPDIAEEYAEEHK